MDENSYLNPATMRDQCENAICNLKKDIETLLTVEAELDKFIAEEEIKSKAFDALKQQMADYKTVIAAMKLANETDIEDFAKLAESLGDEILDGSSILAFQNEALDSYTQNEAIADKFSEMARNIFEQWMSSYYSKMASNHRILAALDYQIYEKWKKKEEFFDQIEADTVNLFQETAELRTAAQNAIRCIGQACIDGVYCPDLKASWRVELTKSVFALNYRERGSDVTWWERFLVNYVQKKRGVDSLQGDILQLMLSPTMVSLIGAVTVQVAGGKSPEEAFASVLGYYVPHFIEDDTFLLCMEVLAECSYIPDGQITEHLAHNEEEWKKNSNDYIEQSDDGYWYIEHQSIMKGMIFGSKYTVNQNGCGAIATYNTLVNLNGGTSPASFPEIVSEYEKHGVVADGALGVSTITVNNYFMKNGYQTQFLSGKEITDESLAKVDEEYNAFIVLAYNDADNVNAAVHFMSITKEINPEGQLKYWLHNELSASGKTEANSMEELIKNYRKGNSKPICVIGVKK